MTNLQKHPKSGVYRFRRTVPEDLRAILGKTTIVESLGTKDLTEAKRRVKEVGLRIDAVFEAARSGWMGIAYTEAQCVVDAWKAEELRRDEEKRFAAPPFNGTVPDTMAMINQLSALNHRLVELKEAEDRRDYGAIEHTLSSLLTRAGRIVDKRSGAYQIVARLMLKASIGLVEEQIRRSGGEWSTAGEPRSPRTSLARPVSGALHNGKPISAIFEEWLAERKLPAKTASEWRRAVRLFTEVVGADIPVASITKDDVREFKQTLLKMPRVLTDELKKKTAPEIIQSLGTLADDQKLSAASVNKHIGALSSVLTWAVDNGYIDSNPASRIRVKDNPNRDSRLPYDEEDLRIIFNSPLYAGRRSKRDRFEQGHQIIRDASFWLPLLAAFTGARLEELGQATLADLKTEDGIDYLRIDTIDEDQSVKTKESKRRVPVHRQIIRCGFLDYVADLRTAGE